ncbi:MAG: hypothetical protein KDC73_08415 [Ignavibacteriae bacterium]|nr:hypothetical protein [Ignavibacteriota bacterium]MCB9242270.1 hypothetical protein [Ignavibacteriales bacterium]
MNENQLSEEKLNDLIAFTKLYGYIKYFHPSSESKGVSWDAFAQYGTRKILEAGSRKEVISTLNELFSPIAPSLLIYSGDADDEYPVDRYTPKDTTGYSLVMWIHDGHGTETNRDKVENVYNSYITNSDTADIKDIKIIEKDLGNGIKAKFPSVLYSNGKTFPTGNETKVTEFQRMLFEESKNNFVIDDKAYFIANVIITWNIFEHFFPYFDVIDEIASGQTTRDEYWGNILKKALKEAYNNESKKDHFVTLQHIVSALRDGHGFVSHDDISKDRSRPPLKIEWIENSPVVVKSNDDDKDITEGDVITEIDGRDVSELIKEIEEKVSASTDGSKKVSSIEMELLRGEYESNITLKVRKPDGKEITKTFRRTEGLFPIINFPYYQDFFQIDSGIYYVNLTKIKWEVLEKKLDTLANAKGIIFDVRGRPQDKMYILFQHLYDTNIHSSRWLIPRITEPDFKNVDFRESGVWDLSQLEPRINGEVVFLTNARAISYGESFMAIVKNYHLGTIIGERTAGTNGNVNRFLLPGGYQISFTGMKVLNHNDSRFHGIGVVPDIEVRKTIKGVSEKRDEQMEKALEFLKNSN